MLCGCTSRLVLTVRCRVVVVCFKHCCSRVGNKRAFVSILLASVTLCCSIDGESWVYPCEAHPCEVYPCEVYPCEVYPCEVHPCEVYPCEVHPCEVYPCEVHPGDIYPHEMDPSIRGIVLI